MKKIGELMSELGFNPQAPDGVKEAFIKHLIKASTGVTVETPSEKKAVAANPTKVKKMHSNMPHQLSFDFSYATQEPGSNKKAVS